MSVARPEVFAVPTRRVPSIDPYALLDSSRRLVTIGEFAAMIGVSRNSVKRIFSHARVRFAKVDGRRHYDLEAALAALAAEAPR